MTVAVDDVRGVAGFIFPGDFVDVALTRTDNGNGPQSFSEVILQHVKVLAIDQMAGQRQEQPTVAKAVTVEVDPDQALRILLAANVGKLSLILRQPAEVALAPDAKVTDRDCSAPTRRRALGFRGQLPALTPNPPPSPSVPCRRGATPPGVAPPPASDAPGRSPSSGRSRANNTTSLRNSNDGTPRIGKANTILTSSN